MENRTLKIFMSCALGAGIGALIALQLNHYFWWIGMLTGGLTGHLSYDFKRVLQAIPCAWNKAVKWRPSELAKIIIRCFRFPITVIILWMITVIIILFLIIPAALTDIPMVMLIGIFAAVLGTFVPILVNEELLDVYSHRIALTHFNPISVCFWYLPQLIWLGLKMLYLIAFSMIRALGRFGWEFFLLIHSEIRLLCGVDAAIGACVGYFAGSAIIGAVAGGIFGVINYEVISKRVLGIIKTRRE